MNTPYPLIVRGLWIDEKTSKLCWINTLKLPQEEEVICSDEPERIAKAIVEMEIRGAPAIGVAAALAIGVYSVKIKDLPLDVFLDRVKNSIVVLSKTRPTAYNLFYALSRMQKTLEETFNRTGDTHSISSALMREAMAIYQEDVESNIKMGEHGARLVPDNSTILTHCNAGALATSAYGTAIAVIKIAWYTGKKIKVIATETRPMLQGARLTVYELMKEGIPVKLITDNAAGMVLRKGLVDLVVVGADRITRDGYVVNKIGTYMIALAAKRNNIPFYVVAPTSTIDMERSIDQVIIEERDPSEVKYIRGQPITLKDADVINYAFDITDPDLVTAIITERGVIHPPLEKTLLKLTKTI